MWRQGEVGRFRWRFWRGWQWCLSVLWAQNNRIMLCRNLASVGSAPARNKIERFSCNLAFSAGIVKQREEDQFFNAGRKTIFKEQPFVEEYAFSGGCKKVGPDCFFHVICPFSRYWVKCTPKSIQTWQYRVRHALQVRSRKPLTFEYFRKIRLASSHSSALLY